ncbi:MAG TPA: hypothetical protein VEC57_02040 [Candidatus Limnocylindrales bacterium]|nr:hypothetical protein [Candidatus Limnocylindrales bacterium]
MHLLRFTLPTAALIAAASARVAFAVITADHADDVCAPAANPCVVTDRVIVVDNATLDFGVRELVVTGNGQLDFGADIGTVLAGTTTVGGKGINLQAGGVGFRGTVTARRACSNNVAMPCLQHAECGAGTCSVGSGNLSVTAPVTGKTVTPGDLFLNATGDLALASSIDLSGSQAESDGGRVTVRSYIGAVNVTGAVKVDSGIFAYGGEFNVTAGTDIDIGTAVSATGGDFDGGEITMNAGRDILIDADITVSSIGGSGSGGFTDMTAGRDIVLSGGSGADRVVLLSEGHTDVTNFAGDGGDHLLFAGRDIVVGQFVSLVSRGSVPDGYGGEVALNAGGDATVHGTLEALSDGLSGDGGFVDVSADGIVNASATSLLSVDGGNVGIGEINSGEDMTLAGAISLIGRQGGFGGFFSARSSGDMTVSGTLTANRISAEVELEACRIHFTSTANYNNNSQDGVNTLIARESMRLDAGSFLLARTGATAGENVLIYRDAAKPPVRNGTITPAPVLQVNANLLGCPVCGNSEIDQGETCDDGNTAPNDACTADCQLAGCVAQTVGGYPANPLCSDGSECTVDTCDVQNATCTHVTDCSDEVSCTVDTCQGTVCVHTPNNGSCSDGNFCDGTEVCDLESGCVEGTAPNCNDSIACTTDACSMQLGACTNTPVHAMCADTTFCNGDELCSATLGCIPAQPATRNCSDGFACTTDTCNETSDSCDHATDDAACEDGNECTINSCEVGMGCVKEPSGLPQCPVTTTTTMPETVCGDATGNGIVQASDSLAALKTAVGSGQCELSVCDVNSSGSITASDALAILKAAVGQPVELNCEGSAAGAEISTTTSTTTTMPPD